MNLLNNVQIVSGELAALFVLNEMNIVLRWSLVTFRVRCGQKEDEAHPASREDFYEKRKTKMRHSVLGNGIWDISRMV